MPDKSKTDLVLRLMVDCAIMGLGVSPPAEEEADVTARVETLADDLIAREKLQITSLERIPSRVFESLANVMLLRIGPGYGRPQPTEAEIVLAEDRLKAVSRAARTRKFLVTDPLLRRGARAVFDGVMG